MILSFFNSSNYTLKLPERKSKKSALLKLLLLFFTTLCTALVFYYLISSATKENTTSSMQSKELKPFNETDARDSITAHADEWRIYLEENAVNILLQKLTKNTKPENIGFVNVSLISMKDSSVQKNQTVLISNGVFFKIGNSNQVSIPAKFKVIDGKGKYLTPGLTDMHVHSLSSNAQKLLNIANGVTTIRDMSGFQWLLNERDSINKNRLLAPTTYQAGQILNYHGMDQYARVIRTEDTARAVVREHKMAGYDFIKIHNRMPLKIYKAIVDEAKKTGWML